jgi:hypothetical protein
MFHPIIHTCFDENGWKDGRCRVSGTQVLGGGWRALVPFFPAKYKIDDATGKMPQRRGEFATEEIFFYF